MSKKKKKQDDTPQNGSRFYSILAAADNTYKSMPVNIRLLVEQVSRAIPEFGPRKLRRKGPGTEFFEARDFEPNHDDPRRIHARLSAKTDKPMVVEKEAEISQRIYLWRDPDPSMDFASRDDLYTKKEVAEIMMLAFARHLTKNEEVVGVIDRKGTYRGGKAAESIAKKMDVRIVTGEVPVVRTRPPKNSTAILFSDFITADLDKLAKSLDQLKALGLSGHLVMVLDPQEIDFDYEGFVKFEGRKGELSEEFKKVENVREDYRKKLAEHIKTVRDMSRSRGFNFILQRTDEPLHFGIMQLYGVKSRDQTPDPILNLTSSSVDKDGPESSETPQSNASQSTPPKPSP